MSDATVKIGVDIGGTFTDLTLFDSRTGELGHLKVASTPEAPSNALIRGVEEITERAGVDPTDVRYLVHGTTIALNALLERRGARAGLVVTKGNRSILDIARLRVPERFSFAPAVPRPLVQAGAVHALGGRVLADGQVRASIDDEDIAELVEWVEQARLETCAICLLNAYANPEHELLVEAALRDAFPDLVLCRSSAIWPEIREYERAMVTLINAYVAPRMKRYLGRVVAEAKEIGLPTDPFITQSNGGVLSAADAAEAPVATMLSGPASGVVGAAFCARRAGFDNCITFDMGGTSADVSLIVDGEPVRSTEVEVAGYPLVMPAVDVRAIGAGGGSIAWLDPGGVLKVGPTSAGAVPGPACYGAGGDRPTVTDAYLLCGLVDPDQFLGGRLVLDVDRAAEAVGELATELGTDVRSAAESILRLATVTLAGHLVPELARHGVDARDFVLLPFGGAGPTHACLLAAEVGIERILVPPSPGTLCATGALGNDMTRDFVQTLRANLDDVDLGQLRARFTEMTDAAEVWMREQPAELVAHDLFLSVDMRYRGQAYDLEVPIDATALDDADRLAGLFHDRHQQIYRHADRDARVAVVNIRVRAVGRTPAVETSAPRAWGASGEAPVNRHRTLFLDGSECEASVVMRSELVEGTRLEGPCIVEQEDTTVPILPGFEAVVDDQANLLVRRL